LVFFPSFFSRKPSLSFRSPLFTLLCSSWCMFPFREQAGFSGHRVFLVFDPFFFFYFTSPFPIFWVCLFLWSSFLPKDRLPFSFVLPLTFFFVTWSFSPLRNLCSILECCCYLPCGFWCSPFLDFSSRSPTQSSFHVTPGLGFLGFANGAPCPDEAFLVGPFSHQVFFFLPFWTVR